MSVTLVEVMGAARCRAAALAAEVAGYVVLLAADQIAAAPRRVSAADVLVTEDGSLRLVGGVAADARAAEAALRELLDDLLLVASSGSAALMRAARRDATGGAERLVAELEVALIPANRSAARRALARLARETARARARGGLAASVSPEPSQPAPQTPRAAVAPSVDMLPPVAPVSASVHSPTPVVVAPEVSNPTPVPGTPVHTAPLVVEKPVLERTEPLKIPPRPEGRPPRNDAPQVIEPTAARPHAVELIDLLALPVSAELPTVLAAEPEAELPAPLTTASEPLEDPIELTPLPIEVVDEDEALAIADADDAAAVAEPPADAEPGTRPEPVVLRRAAGEPAPSEAWLAEPASLDNDAPDVELTDPMPEGALPTPTPAAGADEYSFAPLLELTPSAWVPNATPSPSDVEFLLVEVKPPPQSVTPVSPRFHGSDVSELLERFRVTEENVATDLCRDLKALAGVDGTNAPPSVTPPPVEAPTEPQEEQAATQPSAATSTPHKALIGAVGLVLLVFAGFGSAARHQLGERVAAAAARESCRASLVVDHAPRGARVVVRAAASDSELSRRVGRGPVAKFSDLPCGEALDVVVEDRQAGERRWRRVPLAARDLTPIAGETSIALEVSAGGPLAAR